MQNERDALGRVIKETIDAAQIAFDTAQAKNNALKEKLIEAKANRYNYQNNLALTRERLKNDLPQNQTDAQLEEAMKESLKTWQSAKNKADASYENLCKLSEEIENSVSKLESQLQECNEAEILARDEENQAEETLKALKSEGVHSQLAVCEERLAETKERIRREQLQMDALALLHKTVRNCKTEIVAAVSAPVEKNTTRMLKRIAGPRLGEMHLSQDFELSGVRPQVMDGETVGCENLSGGEQEQLFLIVRLALGQTLSTKEERQLVVLDDVLNTTDTGRMARLFKLLEEATDKLQIVVLTCHQERYRIWQDAKFFNLADLTNFNA